MHKNNAGAQERLGRGGGVTCNQRWARPPASSSAASTAKPGEQQPRRVEEAGEGWSAPPQWEQDRVCPSQQGLDTPVSRQQTQGTGGDSLGVPHAANPWLLHRDNAGTAAPGVQPHLRPVLPSQSWWHWEPQSKAPAGAGGKPMGPPHPSSCFLTPERDRESFSPTGPKSRGAGTAPFPFPGTRWAHGWADPGPTWSPGRGEGPGPHHRGVGAQSISLCRRLLHPHAHPMPQAMSVPPSFEPPVPPLSTAACVGVGGGPGQRPAPDFIKTNPFVLKQLQHRQMLCNGWTRGGGVTPNHPHTRAHVPPSPGREQRARERQVTGAFALGGSGGAGGVLGGP